MEPEGTEFEVYLDIDGEVDEEKNVPSSSLTSGQLLKSCSLNSRQLLNSHITSAGNLNTGDSIYGTAGDEEKNVPASSMNSRQIINTHIASAGNLNTGESIYGTPGDEGRNVSSCSMNSRQSLNSSSVNSRQLLNTHNITSAGNLNSVERIYGTAGLSSMPSNAVQPQPLITKSRPSISSMQIEKELENSDTEVDVDTPFDGKLMGQTKPSDQLPHFKSKLKNMPLLSFHSHQKYSSLPFICGIDSSKAITSTTKLSNNSNAVAVKSGSGINSSKDKTTPTKPSNINSRVVTVKSGSGIDSSKAEISTTKPSSINSRAVAVKSGSGINSSKDKTTPTKPSNINSRVVTVKSGSGIDSSKAEISTTKPSSISSRAVAVKSGSHRVISKRVSQVAKKSTSKQSQSPSSGGSIMQVKFGPLKAVKSSSSCEQLASKDTLVTVPRPHVFKFEGKNTTIRRCPFCSLTMQKASMKNHLKLKHGVSLHACGKCTLAFTDVYLYSEHCAFHLQQEEAGQARLPSTSSQLESSVSHSHEPVPPTKIHRPTEPPASFRRTRSFKFLERSSENIPCPECGTMVQQFSVGHHLKTVHDLNLRTCKSCQLGYTDMNMYNEHCAFHYQQEEERMIGLQEDSVSNIGTTKTLVSAVVSETNMRVPTPASEACLEKKAEVTEDASSCQVTVFEFTEKSTEKMPCPACSVYISQHGLRAHLLNIHKLKLKSCRKCPLAFLDYSQFFEHLAEHYRQSEVLTLPLQKSSNQLKAYQHFKSIMNGPINTPIQKLQEQKSFSASVSNNCRASISEMDFSVKRKLSPKPRKPAELNKIRISSSLSKRQLCSPALDFCRNISSANDDSDITESYFQSPARGVDSNEKVSSVDSKYVESDISPSSQHSYKINQKAAVRKRLCPFDTVDTLYPKKMKLQHSPAAAERWQLKEARVKMVSLESASRPFDCDTCLSAFNLALICPKSFRKHSTRRLFSCTKCSAVFQKHEQLKVHHELQCTFTNLPAHSLQGKSEKEEPKGLVTEDLKLNSPIPSPLKKSIDAHQIHVPKDSASRNDYKCTVCHAKFQYHSVLVRHLVYHTHQYCCAYCKKVFAQKLELLNHFQIMHNGNTQLMCKYCKKRFDYISEFDRHVSVHKYGTVVACTECGVKFSDSNKMLEHLKNVHVSKDPDNKHVKNSMPVFKEPDSKQVKSKQSKSSFKCKICGRTFNREHHLALHIRYGHVTSKSIITKFLSCRICKTVFHKKQGLASHYLRRHGMSMPSTLSTSNKVTSSASKSGKRRPCDEVEIKSRLSSAKAVVNRQPAPECEQSFRENCPICKRSYSTRKVLLHHLKKIHNQKVVKKSQMTHQCNHCKKVYNSYSSLQIHYKVAHNHNGQNFKCKKCSASFIKLGNLKKHCKVTHGISDLEVSLFFPCPVCKQVYKSKKYMRIHWRLKHPASFKNQKVENKSTNINSAKKGKTVVNCVGKAKVSSSNQTKPKGKVSTHSLKKFSCPLCEKSFDWKNNMFRHLQVNHGLTKGDIEYNLGNTTTSASVAYEEKTKTKASSSRTNAAGGKIYLCRICKDCFNLKKSFKRHLNGVHGGKKGFFQCRNRTCRKTFTKVTGLKNHITKSHPRMSLYRCISCKTSFDTSEEALDHKCTSVEVSETGSTADFESRSPSIQKDLDQLDNTSNSVPVVKQECPYRCLTCGAGFYIAREWTRHVQGHLNENSGNSSDCQKVINSTENIRLNIFDILSKDRIFSCFGCDKIFTEKEAFASHTCQLTDSCATLQSLKLKAAGENINKPNAYCKKGITNIKVEPNFEAVSENEYIQGPVSVKSGPVSVKIESISPSNTSAIFSSTYASFESKNEQSSTSKKLIPDFFYELGSNSEKRSSAKNNSILLPQNTSNTSFTDDSTVMEDDAEKQRLPSTTEKVSSEMFNHPASEQVKGSSLLDKVAPFCDEAREAFNRSKLINENRVSATFRESGTQRSSEIRSVFTYINENLITSADLTENKGPGSIYNYKDNCTSCALSKEENLALSKGETQQSVDLVTASENLALNKGETDQSVDHVPPSVIENNVPGTGNNETYTTSVSDTLSLGETPALSESVSRLIDPAPASLIENNVPETGNNGNYTSVNDTLSLGEKSALCESAANQSVDPVPASLIENNVPVSIKNYAGVSHTLSLGENSALS